MLSSMKIIKRLLSPKNIQTKLFIFFIFLVLLIVSAISFVIYFNQKNILIDQAKEKAIGLTRVLASSSLNAVLTDEYGTLQNLIESMNDEEDILEITIIDSSGIILASNGAGLRGTRMVDQLTLKAMLSKTILTQEAGPGNEENIWDAAVPIFELDKRIGTARIKFIWALSIAISNALL